MKQALPGLAKRALAFVLVMVLLLTLFPTLPLTANAAHTGTWTYKSNYEWISGSFETDDADQVYQNNQAYDWRVIILPTKSPPSSAQVVASITDANGNTISSYSTTVSGMAQRVETELCSYDDFPELTTDLYGTFTLTCELKLSGTTYAKLVQTFSRKSDSQFTTTVTSRSNPDNVFTFADPIDLVLNIKQNSGVAASYNAAVTVTNASDTEVLAARGVSLPASTNITLSVKDLVTLPQITKAGTYRLNLTLTDATGSIAYNSSSDFAVVALENSVTATVTSGTSFDFIFNNKVPDLVINLQKNDGIAETLKTVIQVTGTTEWSQAYTTTSANATVTPDLSGLPNPGDYTLTATIIDDAGNLRGSVSTSFSRTNITPMICTLTNLSANTDGNIYSSANDFSGYDVELSLSIDHPTSAGKVMRVKAVGTRNGKPFESNAMPCTLSTKGKATVTIDGDVLGYGIFENLSAEVYDQNGNLMGTCKQSYSFSRVLDDTDPGDLPLLNINDHFTTGKGDATKKLALAAKTGANMWRACIPWASIEKSAGNYDISIVKTVMDHTASNGMQALVILAYGNEEVYGESNPGSVDWLNAYADYCYYVASMMALYYPDQIVGFEIWNEWNHATMSKVSERYRTGAFYVKVVKAASEKIRLVNAQYGTNFKVIAGATAGDGYDESNSKTFIKAMFRASGFFDAIDGVSFHTYSSKETTNSSNNPRKFEYISPAEHDFAARIHNYKTLLTQYNAPDDLEIWLTETGWTTNSEPEYGTGTTDGGKTHITYGATEQEAAAYLVQLYAWALYDGTLDRIFWYDFMNDISNQTKIWANNQTESNYGLIHNWNNSGNQPLAYSAKAGYVAMCALSSKLAGATNGKQISINNDNNIFAYQFSKDGKYITVIWTEGATKTVDLTLSKSISISDMYGNATTYNAGSTTLTLTEAPIYLEYSSGSISFN